MPNLEGDCMKNALLFSVICLFANATFAAQDVNVQLPPSIICTSKSLSTSVRKFEIKDLNTKTPDSDIYDSSPMDPSIAGSRLHLHFSNECDNSYGVAFLISDLIALKNGQLGSITGEMNYADLQSSDINSADGSAEETIAIKCSRKQ